MFALAPVVVDLGPDVGPREVQIVVDACNRAISQGVCLAESNAGDEAPRAVAVARAADDAVRVVRIEVRVASDEGGEAIVRELVFGRRDPLRERWRSVGLAIATLVGEGEQRAREEAEEDAAAAPAPPPEPEAPAPEAPAPESAAPEPPEALPPAPPSVVVPEREEEPEPEAPEVPRVPFEHRSVFVGVGGFTGPGLGDGAWRVGGVLRGSWQARSGLSLGGSLGYAWRASSSEFTAEWFSLEAGVGYRWDATDALSFGALALGGAQRARFEVRAAGVDRAEARWNPRAALELDGRWRATQGFGLWLDAEGSTTGRESRLFVTPERDPIRSSPVEVSVAAGLGWWIE
ncbi:MAG TPA: hypothetical protein VMG12_07440 [Polyangiaceae bacterium]|nr:hypothetical protein [Polyangiaceae bacterium]